MFTGAAEAFEGPIHDAFSYSVTKTQTHALGLHMA